MHINIVSLLITNTFYVLPDFQYNDFKYGSYNNVLVFAYSRGKNGQITPNFVQGNYNLANIDSTYRALGPSGT